MALKEINKKGMGTLNSQYYVKFLVVQKIKLAHNDIIMCMHSALMKNNCVIVCFLPLFRRYSYLYGKVTEKESVVLCQR